MEVVWLVWAMYIKLLFHFLSAYCSCLENNDPLARERSRCLQKWKQMPDVLHEPVMYLLPWVSTPIRYVRRPVLASTSFCSGVSEKLFRVVLSFARFWFFMWFRKRAGMALRLSRCSAWAPAVSPFTVTHLIPFYWFFWPYDFHSHLRWIHNTLFILDVTGTATLYLMRIIPWKEFTTLDFMHIWLVQCCKEVAKRKFPLNRYWWHISSESVFSNDIETQSGDENRLISRPPHRYT